MTLFPSSGGTTSSLGNSVANLTSSVLFLAVFLCFGDAPDLPFLLLNTIVGQYQILCRARMSLLENTRENQTRPSEGESAIDSIWIHEYGTGTVRSTSTVRTSCRQILCRPRMSLVRNTSKNETRLSEGESLYPVFVFGLRYGTVVDRLFRFKLRECLVNKVCRARNYE